MTKIDQRPFLESFETTRGQMRLSNYFVVLVVQPFVPQSEVGR